MATYEYTFTREVSPEEFRKGEARELIGMVPSWGYSIDATTDTGAVFSRRYSPGVFIFLYIILFPLGLLFLLVRPTQRVTLAFSEGAESGSTECSIIGSDKRLRSFLENLGGSDIRQ